MCTMSIVNPVNLLWALMRYSSHTWTEWHFVICCTKLMVWLAILMLYPRTYVSFWCQHLQSWQMLLVDNLIVALPRHGEFHAGWCLNPPPTSFKPDSWSDQHVVLCWLMIRMPNGLSLIPAYQMNAVCFIGLQLVSLTLCEFVPLYFENVVDFVFTPPIFCSVVVL